MKFTACKMELLGVSVILTDQLVHIFSKTNHNNECRTESAQQKHRDQNVIHDPEKKMHSKSVLPSSPKA